ESLRFKSRQAEAGLQRIDLRRADGVGDFEHHFVGHVAPFVGRRHIAVAPPRRAPWRVRASRSIAAIVDILSAVRRNHLRNPHQHAGYAPTTAKSAAAIITAAAIAAARRAAHPDILSRAAHRPLHADVLGRAAAENLLSQSGVGGENQRGRGGEAEQGVTTDAHGLTSAKCLPHSAVAMKPTTLSSWSFLTMRASSPFGNPVTATRIL